MRKSLLQWVHVLQTRNVVDDPNGTPYVYLLLWRVEEDACVDGESRVSESRDWRDRADSL